MKILRKTQILANKNISKKLKRTKVPNITWSEDKSKFSIRQLRYHKKKKMITFTINVFDDKFNLLEEKKIERKREQGFYGFKIEGDHLSNQGEYYVSYTFHEQWGLAKDNFDIDKNHLIFSGIERSDSRSVFDLHFLGDTICYYTIERPYRETSMTIMKHFLDKNFKYLMKEQVLFDPNYGVRNVSIHGMEEAFEGGSIVVVEDAYTSSFDGYSKYEDISIYVKKEAESSYKKYILNKKQVSTDESSSFEYIIKDRMMHFVYNKKERSKKNKSGFLHTILDLNSGEMNTNELFKNSKLGCIPKVEGAYLADDYTMIFPTFDRDKRLKIKIIDR